MSIWPSGIARYVMDSGLFVSLKEKIAARPLVRNLIGNPFIGASVLRNKKPGAATYDAKNPESNRRLTTFEQNIQRLRDLKAQGWRTSEREPLGLAEARLRPADAGCSAAACRGRRMGRHEGLLRRLQGTRATPAGCTISIAIIITDAPSWNPDFAVHAEDSDEPRRTPFPGTRFKHDWKDGYIPLMDHWDGGTQGYLNNRFMLGHVVKNYREMFEHGIHPQGSYQDVFGYIPPDQDFNPNHPSTRTDSMNDRAAVLAVGAEQPGHCGDGSRIGLGGSVCGLYDVAIESRSQHRHRSRPRGCDSGAAVRAGVSRCRGHRGYAQRSAVVPAWQRAADGLREGGCRVRRRCGAWRRCTHGSACWR